MTDEVSSKSGEILLRLDSIQTRLTETDGQETTVEHFESSEGVECHDEQVTVVAGTFKSEWMKVTQAMADAVL